MRLKSLRYLALISCLIVSGCPQKVSFFVTVKPGLEKKNESKFMLTSRDDLIQIKTTAGKVIETEEPFNDVKVLVEDLEKGAGPSLIQHDIPTVMIRETSHDQYYHVKPNSLLHKKLIKLFERYLETK